MGEGITRKANTMSGAYCIAGTRVPVRSVKRSVAGGWSLEKVAAEYHLTPEQVQAALAFRESKRAQL